MRTHRSIWVRNGAAGRRNGRVMSDKKTEKRLRARPGEYLILGFKEDNDEVVSTVVTDLPKAGDEIEDPPMTVLCRRVLFEMGCNDPIVYRFVAMLKVTEGGTSVVLNSAQLIRYVHANFAT